MHHRPIIEAVTGHVVNVVVLEAGADWTPPEGHTIGPDGGQIGDTWDGAQYVRPERPAEPEPVVAAPATAPAEEAPEYTMFQLFALGTRANEMTANGVQRGEYRWHKDGATEDFRLGGVVMDAQDFLNWCNTQI